MPAARCARIAGEIEMELAKQFIDVGILTNQIDEMRAFYGERIRLPYEELLPVGGGVRQYRYGLLGSVLKINHSRDPLPPRIAGGYWMLSISDPRTPMPLTMQDPDGNDLELVPAGQRGVNQIEIHIGVTDEAAFEHFYGDALQAGRLPPPPARPAPPMTLGSVARISMIRDPDGNFIEISQRASLTGPIPS